MKQGIQKFTAKTQGARTTEGRKIGENFITEILNIISIENLKAKEFMKPFGVENWNGKTKMTPDFVIHNSETGKKILNNKKYLILESKYKQISGSDWEKIESNFGYHEYFYNELCNFEVATIVILSGYWRELQKNYPFFMHYFKETYGENVIFDFGDSVEEIYRFCNLLDVKLSETIKKEIIECWNKIQKKA